MIASVEQRLTDAVYARLGRPASYVAPGGDPIPCRVQVMRAGNPQRQNPLEVVGFGGSHFGINVAEISIIVRRSEVAAPEAGSEFTVYIDEARTQVDQIFSVGGDAMAYDAEAREWRCDCSQGWRRMTNKVSAANTALWVLVQATFTADDGWKVERNPTSAQAPKPRTAGAPAKYCDMLDDETPEMLRAFAGQLFDLKLKPMVSVVFLGGEADRRAAAWTAVESLKAALAADPTLAGAVEYARLEAAEDASADRLEWMAGGLRVPVCLLFNAPTQAG